MYVENIFTNNLNFLELSLMQKLIELTFLEIRIIYQELSEDRFLKVPLTFPRHFHTHNLKDVSAIFPAVSMGGAVGTVSDPRVAKCTKS